MASSSLHSRSSCRSRQSSQPVEEERNHRRHKLAGALRIFGRLGFGEGVAGHIPVRDPEHTDHFWVNPFGMSPRTTW